MPLNKYNTTAIIGKNGAGKSSLLDALSFVLFNKAYRDINKPQLPNTITQKNCIVEIEFFIGKSNYKIIRGINPNVFEIYKDGILMNQDADSKDYQEVLEKQILKTNHKTMCQIAILGSANFKPFMQLTTSLRRNVIEDLLDLLIFTTMNTLLKDKVSTNTIEINECNISKKILEEKISIIKEHIQKIQVNNDQLIDKKQDNIYGIETQIIILEETYPKYDEKLEILHKQTEDDKALSKKLNTLSGLRHKIEANLGILKKDIEFFNRHDDCPTCKQPIDNVFKCDEIGKKESEIVIINEGLFKLKQQYIDLEKKISEIMDINQQINEVKMVQNNCKNRINTLYTQKEQLIEEIHLMKKQTNSVESVEKVEDLEKELNYNISKYNELSDEKNVLSSMSVLLKDGGIKAKIIKQYIPIFNKLINKYLSSMEFMCQFDLDEEFKETIKSRYRDSFSYNSFSEGEKDRIDLAILFAWRDIAKMRNMVNTNLLIMDEILDSSLDSEGTDEFLKIINDLTKDTNTIIISHKVDQLYDKFTKVIKVEKYKNFSRIVE